MALRLLTLAFLIGCGARTELADPDDAGEDARSCVGATPSCTLELGTCCDDVGFGASCLDGAWICDPCDAGPSFEFACETRTARFSSECTRFAMEASRLGVSAVEYCGLE